MKKYEALEDERALNRTPLRNMPVRCQHCGYRSRPSASADICKKCKLNTKK